MVGIIFNMAGFSSRTKSVWLIPVFFLMLVLLTRLASIFMQNQYLLYTLYYSCLGIAIILSIAFMVASLNSIFVPGYNLKSEVVFYKKLGYGTVDQFAMKIIIVLISTMILWSFCSFIVWSFNYRLLVVMVIVYSLLLMLRTAALAFKTSLVYYVVAVLIIFSLFYPVYVLPNPAYLL